ncbi:MAG: MaoC family dehydratase [Deinococcales bacterium]
MATMTFAGYRDAAGRELGASPWMPIDQDRIDAFAACTDDRQWIHVDRERAKAGPFGGTIAHGYLTLSLLVPMLASLGAFPDDGTTVVNYGLDRLRFVTPVPSGSRVRLRAVVSDVRPKGDGRLLVSFECTVEIEGLEGPALIAQVLHLLVAPG